MRKISVMLVASLLVLYSCGKGSTAPADTTAAVSVAVQNVVQGIGMSGVNSSARVDTVETNSSDGTNTVNYTCGGGGTVTGTSVVTGMDTCTGTNCNVEVNADVTLNACTETDTTCSKGSVVSSGAMSVKVTATGSEAEGANSFIITVNYNTTEDLSITYNGQTYKCAIDLTLSSTVAEFLEASAHPENLFTGKICGNDWTETWASINDATKKTELCTTTTES